MVIQPPEPVLEADIPHAFADVHISVGYPRGHFLERKKDSGCLAGPDERQNMNAVHDHRRSRMRRRKPPQDAGLALMRVNYVGPQISKQPVQG